jgi:hypothetical protein
MSSAYQSDGAASSSGKPLLTAIGVFGFGLLGLRSNSRTERALDHAALLPDDDLPGPMASQRFGTAAARQSGCLQ